MNSRIGLGLLLVSAGLLAVVFGLTHGGRSALLAEAAGLLLEAGGLYLIVSGLPKKKQ